MKLRSHLLLSCLTAGALNMTLAQSSVMSVPKTVTAGEAFSVATTGTGNATLLIVGPGQVIKRDVKLGDAADFPAGALYNAGTYVAVLQAGTAPATSDTLVVLPAKEVANVSFLARPSRLPVSLREGITGAVYAFDKYHNLVVAPVPVSFELSDPGSGVQKRTVNTVDGAAWIAMDSSAHQGADKFVARVGDISSVRIVEQVPGDPCTLRMSAKQNGSKLDLSTDPVKDCNGNAVPDGTVVTFTESYRGAQSTVDVPIKRGIAQVEMPVHEGATISVASGVVMGNQIGWGR